LGMAAAIRRHTAGCRGKTRYRNAEMRQFLEIVRNVVLHSGQPLLALAAISVLIAAVVSIIVHFGVNVFD